MPHPFHQRSGAPKLKSIMADLNGRSILTVSDMEDFARNRGMIRLFTSDNKIRFRINPEAAKAANVTISSKLLRLAEIVQ